MMSSRRAEPIGKMIAGVETRLENAGYEPNDPDAPRSIPREWAGAVLSEAGTRIGLGNSDDCHEQARTLGWALYRAFSAFGVGCFWELIKGYHQASRWSHTSVASSEQAKKPMSLAA